MNEMQQAFDIIRQQQAKLPEYSPAVMVGHQLMDLLKMQPEAAGFVLHDLQGKGMGIADCEQRIKAWADEHKKSGSCALPGFVDSKNEEKTERNAGYLVVSHSGGGMLRQGTRKGIRRTPANRGMRAHWVVKGLDISEDVCHGMCP